MKDFFASLYEYIIFHNVYSLELFNNNIYFSLVLYFLIPPCITFGIFYFLVKYPFCRWYHWALILLSTIGINAGLCYDLLNKSLVQYIFDSGSFPDIYTFIYNIILMNIIYGFIFSLIVTIILKQFPFPQRNIPWISKK
jgi:glycosyltransferase involved in cell wall biosynthesis